MLKPEWHHFPVGQKVECVEDYGRKVETEKGWFGPLTLIPGVYPVLPKKGERFTVKEVMEDPAMRALPGIVLHFHEIECRKNLATGWTFGFWSVYFLPVIRMKRPT